MRDDTGNGRKVLEFRLGLLTFMIIYFLAHWIDVPWDRLPLILLALVPWN